MSTCAPTITQPEPEIQHLAFIHIFFYIQLAYNCMDIYFWTEPQCPTYVPVCDKQFTTMGSAYSIVMILDIRCLHGEVYITFVAISLYNSIINKWSLGVVALLVVDDK